jgi:O-acetyl-ADP-ribose deacetylase (regulator of RNase III)
MMVEVHMKSLRKILQKAKIVDVNITEPKSYSINERIKELTNEPIKTDNIRSLFEIDISSLKKILRKGYKDPDQLLQETQQNAMLKNIKDFYDSQAASDPKNNSFDKSYTVLSKIVEVMDEFLWSVANFKIENIYDFLRIALNYFQMLSLLNKINEFSEIFNLLNDKTSNIDSQKLKGLLSGLHPKAKEISKIALECQPYNLYTLRTTGGFFHQVGLRKEYKKPKISDEIKDVCEMIIENLNFSHYKLVSEHLVDSKKFIKSLESRKIESKEVAKQIVASMGSRLLEDEKLVLSFFNSISEILKQPQSSPVPPSCIIPVVDNQGNEIQNAQIGSGSSNIKRSLNSPSHAITTMSDIRKIKDNLSKIVDNATKNEKLLEITFTNGKIFSVVTGDIKDVDYAQAVVNAANKQLGEGRGITGAIFQKAGITNQLKNYLINNNIREIPEGFAVISDGVRLKNDGVSFIIHAVGPDLREKKQIKDAISSLKDISYAVKNAIRIRESIEKDSNINKVDQQAINNMNTIVIPLISGGIFSGELGKEGYEFIIMSNLAAIFDVLKITDLTISSKIPGEVILIENFEQKQTEKIKITKILNCAIKLCEALQNQNQIYSIKHR